MISLMVFDLMKINVKLSLKKNFFFFSFKKDLAVQTDHVLIRSLSKKLKTECFR